LNQALTDILCYLTLGAFFFIEGAKGSGGPSGLLECLFQ